MYQKNIKDGYIISVVRGVSAGNITESEYNEICQVVRNKPITENGFDYRLREDLIWEKYEIILENKEGE